MVDMDFNTKIVTFCMIWSTSICRKNGVFTFQHRAIRARFLYTKVETPVHNIWVDQDNGYNIITEHIWVWNDV